jgi:energy-coupling factor transporter ATP-binding protein EcfA2
MSFWQELEAGDKKGIFKSDDNTVSYSTGITVLDYANGFWNETVNSEGNKTHVPILGIQGGSMVSIIGSSGAGKTTLALQIGWNIVKPYEDGMLFAIDCEKTMTRQRVVSLAGADYDEPRIRLVKSHTSIEDVLDNFNKICDAKEAGGKKYMYEVKTGARTFWQYVPTVYIIDSLPSFNSKEYNVEDLGNNIDQMKASKDITRFYTNVLDRAWKYNCIFIVINHIRPNTIMNPYAPPPQGLLMINPQTETLPRGTVPQYFSNTYFRIKTKKSAAYTMEDDGFVGYKCDIILAKTKTNTVGTSFPVTFNSAKGFDPIYSIYEFANSLGLVQGRNPYLSIKGFEDRKFNRKEFISLMSVDKEFREGVLRVLKPYYEGLLGTKKIDEEEENTERLAYGDIDLNDI